MEPLRTWLTAPQRGRIENTDFGQQALTKEEAKIALMHIEEHRRGVLQRERVSEMREKRILYHSNHNDIYMPFEVMKYGNAPPGNRSLYISLHGGGGTSRSVNDEQWVNQQRIYRPEEGFYVAPRAPTNTWDMWHQPHIDPMFDRLIENFVVFEGVSPNKVYIAGYSAGGDGVYRLAPRMADRWAGAAMMAGHPGEAEPHNLNNLPYIIQCGAKDTAYNRNQCARDWGNKLGRLARENPEEYPHECIVYPQYGHWMEKQCARAIPWMAAKRRNPWPKKINWHQGNVCHTRFAWLAHSRPRTDDLITATVSQQTITLQSHNMSQITLRLSDELLDLDRRVIVRTAEGTVLFNGMVRRSVVSLYKSMQERFDTYSAASVHLDIKLN